MIIDNKLIPKFNIKPPKNPIALFICGIPASGKSTIRNKLIKDLKLKNYFLIDPDEYLKYFDNDYNNTATYITKLENEAVRNNYHIIFDKTCSYMKSLDKYIKILKAKGFKIIIYIIQVDIQTAIERNKTRDRIVPAKVLYEKYQIFLNNKMKFLDLNFDELHIINNK